MKFKTSTILGKATLITAFVGLCVSTSLAQFFLPGVSPDPNSVLKSKNVLEVDINTNSHLEQQADAKVIWDSLQKYVGFRMTHTTDPTFFTTTNLAPFDIIVFNYVWEMGDLAFTTASERAAIQAFRGRGGSFVSYHTSLALHLAESSNPWTWARDSLCGMDFVDHNNSQNGTMTKTAAANNYPVMSGLPTTITLQDEWYSMTPNPASLPNTVVLDTLNEATMPSGAGASHMAPPHPSIWIRNNLPATGRIFCTILDHEPTVVTTPFFHTLLLRAAEYAAGYAPTAINAVVQPSKGGPIFVENGALHVKMDQSHGVMIWSQNGQLLFASHVNDANQVYYPEALKHPGLYLVQVNSQSGRFAQSVIIP